MTPYKKTTFLYHIDFIFEVLVLFFSISDANIVASDYVSLNVWLSIVFIYGLSKPNFCFSIFFFDVCKINIYTLSS